MTMVAIPQGLFSDVARLANDSSLSIHTLVEAVLNEAVKRTPAGEKIGFVPGDSSDYKPSALALKLATAGSYHANPSDELVRATGSVPEVWTAGKRTFTGSGNSVHAAKLALARKLDEWADPRNDGSAE